MHSDDATEEGALRFLEAVCAYRAGFTTEARDGFAACAALGPGEAATSPLGALRCASEWSLALALRRTGELGEGARLARKAAAEARRCECHWLEGAARLALGRVLRDTPGEVRRAEACFEEAHRLMSVARPPDALGLAYVRQHQARLALDAGNASEALSLLREARSGFGRTRHHRALAHSRIDQGWAHVQLRAIGAACECGREAFERLLDMGDQRGALRAEKLLARAALEDQRFEESARLFAGVAERAYALGDEMVRAEGYVGVARARFALGEGRAAAGALGRSRSLLAAAPQSPQSLQWQAIDLARRIRQRRFADLPARLRRLRNALAGRGMPRLTAECLALCGFELAHQGRLREAAPALKEALAMASQPDAIAWTERFLSTAASVDVRQWITSLVGEIHEHTGLAERYEDLSTCAVAGLHDVRNLATRAYAALEVMTADMEAVPDRLRAASDSAFQAGRLADTVMGRIVTGDTEMVIAAKPLDIVGFLAGQKQVIEQEPALGQCALAADKGLSQVLADENYLTRVFGNLISNSAKYAPGSDITLSARADAPQQPGHIIVGFADSGPGIDPHDAEIIFNAFKDPSQYRQRRPNHGSGFGLHYCKMVIEAHGGRIWVDPRPGEGAAFYFTLPVAEY